MYACPFSFKNHLDTYVDITYNGFADKTGGGFSRPKKIKEAGQHLTRDQIKFLFVYQTNL